MPLHGVDRLCALTGSTLRVFLCFDNTTTKGEVFCVPVCALYTSIPLKATKNMRGFYLVSDLLST